MRCSASEQAAHTKVKAKDRLYKEQCAAQNLEFMATAICNYGGWLPEGIAFLKRLAASVVESSGQDKSVVMSKLWQRVSVALWRDNAGIILQRHPQNNLGQWDIPPS